MESWRIQNKYITISFVHQTTALETFHHVKLIKCHSSRTLVSYCWSKSFILSFSDDDSELDQGWMLIMWIKSNFITRSYCHWTHLCLSTVANFLPAIVVSLKVCFINFVKGKSPFTCTHYVVALLPLMGSKTTS